MKRSHVLLAGLALILLSNAIALGGVWYNRSAEPDSRLLLSEREAPLRYNWQMKENSGVALRLNWRMPVAVDSESRHAQRYFDQTQMQALGFEPAEGEHRRREQGREALVVLELAGPAYAQALERAQRHLAEAQKAHKARPGDKALKERLDAARDAFEDERDRASRLFVVDVGLDAQALRQRFPDRRRYAIVRGQVRPWHRRHEGGVELSGMLYRLSVEQLNVPGRWRERFAEARSQSWGTADDHTRYEVEVRFGQRLEPWVAAVPRFSR